MSADRAHRLWRTSGLQVPRKRPRRRVASTRPRVPRASGPNQVWAYDFVFDACANDHQLECLTVIDEWSHERLVDVHVARRHFLRSASDVVGSSCLGRVIQELARLHTRRTEVCTVGEWSGVCVSCSPALAEAAADRNGSYRRWKALAERHGRKRKRSFSR